MTKIILPTSMEGKTVLIAGAAGFVPSTLAEHYLKLGAKVIGLDNFITGSQSNIDLLSKNKNFEFHKTNIYESLLRSILPLFPLKSCGSIRKVL